MTGLGWHVDPAAAHPVDGAHRPPLLPQHPGVAADRLGHAPMALFVAVALADTAGAEAGLEIGGDAMLEGRAPSDDVAMLMTLPAPTRFEHEMPAAPSELAPLRRALSRWLALIGTDPDGIADILVTVGEGAANAVEHAYRDGAAGTVHVVAELVGDDLRTTIRDHGSWRAAPALGNRGRGTAIMRAAARRVDVRRDPDGTTVVIEHRLPRADRTASR